MAYARTKESLTPILIAGGKNVLGKAFYGFRLEDDGTMTINKITDGTTVYIPENGLTNRSSDYDQWVWTQNKLVFSINASGHLLMEVR